MNANDIYTMGIERFNKMIESLTKQENIINFNCSALEYVRTLTRMYAEADGEYWKCCGSDILNDNCRLSYYAICMIAGKKKNGVNVYRMLPGGFSAQPKVVSDYKIIFDDKTAFLLKGGKYDELKPVTVTVKSVTGNIANREYMLKIHSTPKTNNNAEYIKFALQAQQAEEAKKSILADGLSEDGFRILIDKFKESLLEEESTVMSALAKKTHEIQKAVEQKEKHTYHFNDSYNGNFTTADIYNDNLIAKANEILNRTGRLLIIGETGSGKSELAYKLIYDITGEEIGKPNGADAVANYNRVCIANARNGYSFWYEDDNQSTIGKLRLFVEHIRNNNITEPCVFVGNEIQTSDFGYLVGNALFEGFNNPDRVDGELLPSNLYIIFIGCHNRNFGIDDQVYGRVEHIQLEYLSGGTDDGEVVAEKIINNIGGSNLERSRKIVELVREINHNEKVANFAPVISTRELIKKLKGQKTAMISKPEDKEGLTNVSKQLLAKLERL